MSDSARLALPALNHKRLLLVALIVATAWLGLASIGASAASADGLQIEKDGPGWEYPGEEFEYTLTVTNPGQELQELGYSSLDLGDAIAPHVTDTLPAGLTYLGYDADSGVTCSISGQDFSCDLPTMALDDEIEITIDVRVGFELSNTTITNQAAVAWSSDEPVAAADFNALSNVVATDIGPSADLAITKTAPPYAAAGWPLTYTINVVNNGPDGVWDPAVVDTLPAGLTLQSANWTTSEDAGTCDEWDPGEINCDLESLDPGETAQVVIVVVPDVSLVGTTLCNTATIEDHGEGQMPDPNEDNNSSTVCVPVYDNAYPTSSNMVITKTPSTAKPKLGQTITYQITTTNQGPATASAATLTDTMPAGLLYVSASGDGTCSFTSPVLSCQLGDVPNGASRTVTVTAIVVKTGSLVNVAVVSAQGDRVQADNTASAPVTAAAADAKLSLSKRADKKSVHVGKKVGYSIKVKNTSSLAALDVDVCDLLPERLSVVKRGGGKLKNGDLCWNIPVLKAGSSRTYKVTLRVSNGGGSKVKNPARASADNADTVRASATVRVPHKKPRRGGTTG